MIKIKDLRASIVTLPFRFAFKHSLASRSYSENLIVEAVLEDSAKSGSHSIACGFGEGIPRDYVTGETIDDCLSWINTQVFPRLKGQSLTRSINAVDAAMLLLKELYFDLELDKKPKGASFCAVELAVLDAVAKINKVSLAEALATRRGHALKKEIVYGGVVPFSSSRALSAILWFYRLYGFETVKLKVGGDIDRDVRNVETARRIMGRKATLRVDANCAWTFDETIEFAGRAASFDIASIEQPVPADRIDDLSALAASLKEEIVVDESLLTIETARALAERKACGGFNIRISKVGGLTASQAIIDIARANKLSCHLGAQVGESGILTAAGRALAVSEDPFVNHEGAANFFLLKSDLTDENLTCAPHGIGRLLEGPGLGVTVNRERLARFEKSPKNFVQSFVETSEVFEKGVHA